MEFNSLQQRAMEIRRQYARREAEAYGRAWSGEEIALGFVGDVGDLAKLVQAASGVRRIPDARQKLAHELSDCLWSLMVLADTFEVDLEAAFNQTMNELEAHLNQGPIGEG